MYSLQGAGYNLLRNPDEFLESLGMKTSAQPSTQNSSLAPTKENQAKRAAQTQSKASSQPKKKKPGFESSFEAYESPYSKSPIYTPRYDWQNDQQERLRRFGINPTAHTEPTTPQTTSRTQNRDAYDSRVRAAYAERERQIDFSDVSALNAELADIEAAENRDPNSAWYKRLVRAWESGDRKTYEQVEREMATRKERVKYILDSRNRTYEDDFIGQFGASYHNGDLEYEEAIALENPTFDNKQNAEGLRAARDEIRRNNAETLAYDAENPLVSQIIPENLPRLIDRVGEGLEYFDTGAVFGALDESARNMHYSRNRYNVDLPENDDAARAIGWKTERANCHQFTAPDGERYTKYISPDGKREVIFNEDGQIVYAAEDQGSYNYANPNFWVQHGLLDILPWIRYGNTPYDTTTPQQRIGGLFNFG
ncbi:MAG: hypothetical protein IJP38_09550 [Oscillospiraceae bacterium]|nr:hypothetical protein [Oscillospiraceae bacterium]